MIDIKSDLTIDDLVPKQKINPKLDDGFDITDYKMVSMEVVKREDKETHISTLWRKNNDT